MKILSLQMPNPTHTPLRIIIAGGGTGGHIFPAIAVAQAIQKLQPDASILFVGAQGKMEMEKVPQAGYQIVGLTIAGFNRQNIFKNLTLPFKLIKSFIQVKTIFNQFKPNAVFGVGGYSSFPVLKYAQTRGIPTFIHEANAFAGKANQWLGARATKIFTGTKGMEQFFPFKKIQVTGNPVRQNIAEGGINKEKALIQFGLLPNHTTILIIGGSLGAVSINQAIQQNLAAFEQMGLQLIWQTGKPNAAMYKAAASQFGNVYVDSFINDMSAAYASADMVVSRSGAMAVAEISMTGKACIFVPYPHAAEDHQTYNAKVLVKENAAQMIADKNVITELLPMIEKLMANKNRLNEMAEKIKSFAWKNADQVIAAEIINEIDPK
jgi:UDP-N-acetylglucosamine--N-acetylmuramyl-(pentapeptide) pyrophosphoryl-undecaprenol N-acetylglucosamine transferase